MSVRIKKEVSYHGKAFIVLFGSIRRSKDRYSLIGYDYFGTYVLARFSMFIMTMRRECVCFAFSSLFLAFMNSGAWRRAPVVLADFVIIYILRQLRCFSITDIACSSLIAFAA